MKLLPAKMDTEKKNRIDIWKKMTGIGQFLFESSSQAILLMKGLEIVDCNSAALKLLDLEFRNQLVGRSLLDICPEKQEDGILSLEKAQQILANAAAELPQKQNWKFSKSGVQTIDCELSIAHFDEQDDQYFCLTISKSSGINKSGPQQEVTEEFLRGIIETIPQPIFVKDNNFIYTYCNQAFLNYLGKPKEEIIGASVFQISDPEKAEIYHQADQALFESGGFQIYESKVRYQDKTDHDVIFHKNIITDKSGHKIGIIGFIEDITELKRKTHELQASESKYKKIFEHVQDVFYQTDLNGIITEISPSIEKYSKYIHADVIGEPIEKFYANPDDRAALIQAIKEKTEVQDFEVLLKGKDGQVIWGSVNAHYIKNEQGEITGIEGTIRDLTDRKRTEEELKRSLSLFQATLNSTSEGILVVDLNGHVTSFNHQFVTMFGIPNQIIEQKNDAVLLNFVVDKFKDPDQFIRKVNYLYLHSELESFDVLELQDGRTFERNSCPQRLDGQPIGRVWSFKDVTIRKKAQAELQLMAHALKSINECISITDIHDRILFVNEAFLQTYGYSPEELIGKNISMVRSPMNDPLVVSQILDLTNENGWKGELMNRRKDGTDFPISLSTTIVKNEQNKMIGLVGVAIDITERQRVENELRESEARYRSFFNGSPDAILLTDAETGLIIDANKAASILLKKPVDKIIGMLQTEIHPSGSSDHLYQQFQKNIRELTESGVTYSHENLVLRSNGTVVPVEILANIIHIKGKAVIQGVFRDISERKHAEQALLESEKRYRQLIDNQGEGISVVDPNENFVFANPAAEAIFGVPPGGLINRNLRDFIKPIHFEKILEESQKRSKNQKSSYEIEIITPSGRKKDILVTATPQTDSEGKYTGTFGVFRDISDRKLAEELLRQSELKYRTLIQTMPDGVYRSTPEGKFVEVNPAMVKMLGYNSKEELMAIDIKAQLYFNPKDRESLVIKENPEELDVYPLKKKDGTAVWVEDHGWYIKDQNGNIIFHEGISRDVTDRKIAEMKLQKYAEELAELNATKDKFFSIIAHDVKTPFNSILGLSELIKQDARHLDVGTIEQYAGIIHSTSKNTYRLLENLLDWARIQQSRMPFNPKSIILKGLVNEIIELTSEKADSKKIRVKTSIPDHLIVQVDQDMLKTVFRNLISNALKFTPINGTVEIAALSRNNETEIQVKDTGIGITPENIDKLFKIDSTFSQRGTENEKGTGLGLILCKEFIEKHGGTIWVKSEPGNGSTFYFTIQNNIE